MMPHAGTNIWPLSYALVDTMPKKTKQFQANPRSEGDFATVVRRSTPALPPRRRHSMLWCFCAFCGRQTEYSVARETVSAVSVYERMSDGSGDAKAVPLTDAIRAKAKKVADELVARYEQAIAGLHGPYAIGEMIYVYCDVRQMLGDQSVNSFRDQVERRALDFIWRQQGDMYGTVRVPGHPNGAQRPSKLYCDLHQPRRSESTRRAYQRDRGFALEYEVTVQELWSRYAGELRQWHIDDHTLVRDAAYYLLRVLKAPTRILDEYSGLKVAAKTDSREKFIEDYYDRARASLHRLRQMNESKDWLDELRENGVTNQYELARRFGISRQAMSAAIKRRTKSRETPTT